MDLDKELGILEDQELFDRLEKAGLAAALVTDPKWAILNEALKRLGRACGKKLAKCNPTDLKTIVECQFTVNFCEEIVPSILRVAHSTGELAFNELKDRGVIPDPSAD